MTRWHSASSNDMDASSQGCDVPPAPARAGGQQTRAGAARTTCSRSRREPRRWTLRPGPSSATAKRRLAPGSPHPSSILASAALVPEMTASGEPHGHVARVAERDGGLVVAAAPGLGHGGRPDGQRGLDPVVEGVEGVAGDHAALERLPALLRPAPGPLDGDLGGLDAAHL